MLSTDPDICRLMAIRAIESGLLRLKWLAAATRFEIAMRRHDRALRHALKFNPDQPRVPRGNSDGGQWMSGGDGSSPHLTSAKPTASKPRIRFAQLANAIAESRDTRPSYDTADAVLLPPKGINAQSSTQKLTYQFNDSGQYLGGVTVTNEDRTAVGQTISAINGTPVHVGFEAQINTANGSSLANFEISKSLSPGSSITIPWKEFGPMQGPGNVTITVTNKGSLYTGIIIGANRIQHP